VPIRGPSYFSLVQLLFWFISSRILRNILRCLFFS
jgi:hypothetical protein